MSRVTKQTITYKLNDGTEKSDVVFVRRLRYSNAMRLLGVLMKGSVTRSATDGQGARVNVVSFDDVALENRAHYNLELIAARLCDADGKHLYTPEDVDAWSDPDEAAFTDAAGNVDDAALEAAAQLGAIKIKAYAAALDVKAKAPAEIAGNSSATPEDSSSSS